MTLHLLMHSKPLVLSAIRLHYQNLLATPPKKMMRCFRQSIPWIFNSTCLRVFLAECDMVQFSEIKMCLEMCLQRGYIR